MESVNQLVADASSVEAFDHLARRLDQFELENPDDFVSPQWPHPLHLMAHIYTLRLEAARFLYKRLPDGVKSSNAQVQTAFTILQKLWNKDYESVWSSINYAWSKPMQPLVSQFRVKLQHTIAQLVSVAYSEISPAKLVALLGCNSEAEVLQVVESYGWKTEGNMILPAPMRQEDGGASADTQAAIKTLGDYVVHLDY